MVKTWETGSTGTGRERRNGNPTVVSETSVVHLLTSMVPDYPQSYFDGDEGVRDRTGFRTECAKGSRRDTLIREQ